MNVVDSAGNVQCNYDFDIYGMGKAITENGLKNPVRYAGEYFDEESGLYYLRGRYYSPDTMRFISEDTNKGKIGEPLTLNLYTYCEGNPVRYVDRDGHVRSDATANGGGGGGDVPSGGGGAGGVLWGIYEGGKVLINKAGNAVSNGAQKVKDVLSKEAAEATFKEAANVGKFYKGQGTVIDTNPVNKIIGICKDNAKDPYHFVNRVIEREVSAETVMNTFKNPQVILSQWNGQRYLYITDKAAVAVSKSGEIITTWAKKDFGPVMEQILKEATK